MRVIYKRCRRRAPIIFGLLAITLAAACGSASSDAESDSNDVRLGVIPIIDIAPIQLGIERGVFADADLNVTTENAQGGAAIVPAVMSGDFDFGYSNIVSLLLAREKGLPVKIVAIGARASNDVRDDGSGQLMVSDKSIKAAEDLEGKKIAVNTLKGINEVAVSSGLEEAGADPNQVELVEVAIPDMPAALESGQVAAAMMSEPFITIANDNG